MSRKGLIIGLIGAGGLGIATVARINSLQETAKELEAVVGMMVHKVTFSKITLRLDVLVKNPTQNQFSITPPFVKLRYKDSLIGSSQVSGKNIDIPALGQSQLDPIMLEIPVLGLFSIGGLLLDDIQSGNAISIKAEISTIATVPFLFGLIPVTKRISDQYDVTLKQAA